MFYVYITASMKNGTLYIGHTDDIIRRAWQHKTGALPGFAKKYKCRRLVWYADFPTRDEAQTRERQMKAWRRSWKIDLIEQENPGWRDLMEDEFPIGRRHYRMPHSLPPV